MKLTSLIAALQIASLAMAAATPRNLQNMAIAEAENSSIEKRQQIDTYYITLCQNKDYGGRCERIQAAWDICCGVFYSLYQKVILTSYQTI